MNLDAVDSELYEFKSLKKRITFDLPFQVGLFVYSFGKLQMLEFDSDCIKKYLPDNCFEFIEINTDSLYMALSGNSLQDLVKPELTEEFFKTTTIFYLA